MAEITSYPTANPKSGDYLLGAQVGAPGDPAATPTKKFTVGSVTGIPDNNGQLYNTVGLNFKWNTRRSPYKVVSTRTGTNYSGLVYSKLYIEFENLELKSGSTYGLLMERFKSRHELTDVGKPSGFKRMSNNGAAAPFDERVFELPITTTTGQYFDFKFDLYYSAGVHGFPLPSGFGGKKPGRKFSTQYLAFRIVKRTGSLEEISPVVAKLKMIGFQDLGGGDPSGQPVITFGTY